MQLIIAEKPSVARDLARVLGLRRNQKTHIEGEGRVITWCVGHLVELEEPAAYDERWKSWRLETLPMIPEKFRLRPSSSGKDQYKAVRALLRDKRFVEVVNACDAGREGELIFRYVYELSGSRLPVKRLWISSLTDEAIRDGFAKLRPGSAFDGLADAARCRSEADWLVGLNATRGVTVKSRTHAQSTLYSIGRVQTPTLALLVKREKAIRDFVPRDYWEIKATFTTEQKERFTATWTFDKKTRLGALALAEEIVSRCQAHSLPKDPRGPRVESIQKKIVREAPPLLFDLTSLQRTANSRFGFSAARTLEIAQALYETHKILTYPRTDSRHLSSDVAKELPKLFRALEVLPDYRPFASHLLAHPPKITRRVFDDAKVQDHHAIIPTGKSVRLEALSVDERRIFDLVVRRFLGAFYPDAEFASTELVVIVGAAPEAAKPPARAPKQAAKPSSKEQPSPEKEKEEEIPILEETPPPPDRFLARGRIRLVAGWQEVAGIEAKEEAKPKEGAAPDPSSQSLPALTEGEQLEGAFTTVAKKTVPPPRYTEATLLSAMEYAGRTLENEELRQAMKDCGLGTPATRASIIETLLKRNYVTRERKSLLPTPMGMALVEALPHESLGSPELTGAWEARLARIARGEDSRSAFMRDICAYVKELVDAIRASSPALPSGGAPAGKPVGSCPLCGGEVHETAWAFACTSQSPPCRLSIRKMIAGRKISRSLAEVLLSKRRSQTLQGFTSKAGKKFSAALVLEKDGSIQFSFEGGSPASGGTGSSSTSSPARHSLAPKGATRPATAPSAPGAGGAPAALLSPEKGRGASSSSKQSEATPVEAGSEVFLCPRCRKGNIVAGKRGWGCARWREGCGFVVWFETAGKTLTPTQLRDLLTRGKTRKGTFHPEGGPAQSGRLILKPEAQGGAAYFEPC